MSVGKNLDSLLENGLNKVDPIKKLVETASVVFLASFYLWGVLTLKLFSGLSLQSSDGFIPVALRPALLLFVGIVTAILLTAQARRFSLIRFLRATLVGGMLLDFASYELLTNHNPYLLVLLYAHTGVLLLSLGFLHLGLIRVVICLGILCLTLPWFLIPIIPVFDFVSTH